jgi:Ras-related protein Rab-23
LDNDDIRLMLWDTAGQEEFDQITKKYYQGDAGVGWRTVCVRSLDLAAADAHACVVAFSTTDRASFDAVESWIRKVRAECDDIPMVLVQNKIDLIDNAVMSPTEAEELARKVKLKFYRTSVRENVQVEAVFEFLARRALERRTHANAPEPEINRRNMMLFEVSGS